MPSKQRKLKDGEFRVTSMVELLLTAEGWRKYQESRGVKMDGVHPPADAANYIRALLTHHFESIGFPQEPR